MGNVFHFRNCMIFIDCVYCQPLYPVLRFLKKTKQNKKNLFLAAQKKFTEKCQFTKSTEISKVCLLLK
ncbi:similar to calmodulin regulated spectrin-associated protein 1 (predicted), isoform CRA_b [Rattus norvegicus]|uniref:Similar to calmodulin regulated spectrin-associated protein 1 (Predicted), isoform CRA_b n=1 Tax=Rattus norvegicus TaxID=10116 RepID=A6JTB6_RAT|nr:similar to calmodulin regulated spectrin-associated protein 1 (predicted), isoform CRA_b [Rattus norvegicus]